MKINVHTHAATVEGEAVTSNISCLGFGWGFFGCVFGFCFFFLPKILAVIHLKCIFLSVRIFLEIVL